MNTSSPNAVNCNAVANRTVGNSSAFNKSECFTNQSLQEFTAEEYLSPLDVPYIRVIFISIYTLVFACCFFGNLLVILVILKHRKMRTITNFLLANLAVADLCVGIFCVLPNLMTNLWAPWILGRVMCKVYYFVQSMSYTASVSTLTVISIERYFAIIHPIRSKQMAGVCLLLLVVVILWLSSAAVALPYLLFYDIMEVPGSEDNHTVSYCFIKHQFDMKAYVTAGFALEYLLPLVLMCITYTRISIVLWRTSKPNNLKMKDSDKVRRKDKETTNVSSRCGVNNKAYKPVPHVARHSSEIEDNDEDDDSEHEHDNGVSSYVNDRAMRTISPIGSDNVDSPDKIIIVINDEMGEKIMGTEGLVPKPKKKKVPTATLR